MFFLYSTLYSNVFLEVYCDIIPKFHKNSYFDDHFERGIYLQNKLISFVYDVKIIKSTIEIGYATEMLTVVISKLFSMGYQDIFACEL